ncbi:hypothetical protein OFB47_27480, partial [Escherichia coli]|nr:hypothetical protein [Escherichia coli]
MVTAFAQKSIDDKQDAGDPGYKALVLVYLAGGIDGNNIVIPNHNSSSISNYQAYAAARSVQGLALDQSTLLPITVPRMGGLSYGLHPAFGTVTGGINNGI